MKKYIIKMGEGCLFCVISMVGPGEFESSCRAQDDYEPFPCCGDLDERPDGCPLEEVNDEKVPS